MESRVEEVIYRGSVYEAIFEKYITCQDVLLFLLTEERKRKEEEKKADNLELAKEKSRYIAYANVCKIDKNQMIEDKPFILQTDSEGYLAIYTLHFGNESYSDVKILEKIQNIYPLLEQYKYRLYNILSGTVKNLLMEEHMFVVGVRDLKNISKVTDFKLFLMFDYLPGLEKFKVSDYINHFIEKCEYLSTTMPNYWNMIKKKYESFAKKHFLRLKNKSDILRLNKYFNIYSEAFLKRRDFIFFIDSYPDVIKAYILGFPVHIYLPSEKVLSSALDRLSEVGVEKYCEEMLNKFHKPFYFENDSYKIANFSNVIFEEFKNLNSFDVVYYFKDTENDLHVFQFSRDEFDKCIKEKKNFYTGELLPLNIIEEMKARNRLANIYSLPKFYSLVDLLKKIEQQNFENIKIDNGDDIQDIEEFEEDDVDEEEYEYEDYDSNQSIEERIEYDGNIQDIQDIIDHFEEIVRCSCSSCSTPSNNRNVV